MASILPLLSSGLPLLAGVKSLANSKGELENYELTLNNFWRPQLAVIGFEGLPTLKAGGNVIYKELTMKLSLRLPPTLDS